MPATNPAQLRTATAPDAELLSPLATDTFTETFGHLYPPEDLTAYFSEGYSPAKLAAEISKPGSLWLIAELDGFAVGYAQAGACTLPHPEASPTHGEMKRLYVRRSHHNLGLGQRMLARSLKFLEQHYPGPLWVGVYSENLGAQRLYQRHGFAHFGEYEFPVGKTRDREFIFRKDG